MILRARTILTGLENTEETMNRITWNRQRVLAAFPVLSAPHWEVAQHMDALLPPARSGVS